MDYLSPEFEVDDYFGEVDHSPNINLHLVFQENKFKALDNIVSYDELDAAMVDYILDDATWCYENYATKDDIRWVNTRTRESHLLDPDVLREGFAAFFKGKREDTHARLRKKRKYAIFTYNPYTIELEFTQAGMRCFNTYHPPSWKLNKQSAVLPAKVDEFFRHLFPKLESREYVFDWLSNGLRHRNLTYLLLLSTQGAGKGIFSNFIKALFGSSNSTIGNQTFITKEFNANIKHKQILILNEITAKDAESVDKLKTLVDDFVLIEGKHMDATEHQNHLNVIITINRPDAIEIDDSDRRYSVVHVNDNPLKDVTTAERIAEYADMYKDPEIVGQFGQWLMERKIERNMLQKYVDNEKMSEIDDNLMYNWQKFILHEVCANQITLPNPFTSKELNELMIQSNITNNAVGRLKLQKFIQDRCGETLVCRRQDSRSPYLLIEFRDKPTSQDDGINF